MILEEKKIYYFKVTSKLCWQQKNEKKGKFLGIFGCLLTQNQIINELIKILNSLDSSRPCTSLLENAETWG